MPFLKRPVGGGIILGVMLLGSAQVSAQTSPAWNQKLVQDKLEKHKLNSVSKYMMVSTETPYFSLK